VQKELVDWKEITKKELIKENEEQKILLKTKL
jgi:hypothetical protein